LQRLFEVATLEILKTDST